MYDVLLACNHAGFGGVSKYVIDLAKYLKKSNKYTVSIATGIGRKDLLQEMRMNSDKLFIIPHLYRNLNPYNDVKAYFEVRKLLKNNHFDIIHSNGAKAGFLFRRVAYEFSIPNIYTHHLVVYKQFQSPLNPLYKFLERTASNWCDKIIVVTKSAKDELVSDHVTPDDKIEVVYNGLDSTDIKYTKVEARNLLDIPDTKFVVTSVSRLEPPKDPFTALLSIKRLLEIRPSLSSNLLFYFVGDGELKPKMINFVNANGLQDIVKITGFETDVDKYLAASDAFILSTDKEGLPISILEAMKYNLPVIATDVDGIPEEVEHGQTGFLFRRKDFETLCTYLITLIENKSLCESMGKSGRKRMEKFFLQDTNFRMVEMIYDSVKRK